MEINGYIISSSLKALFIQIVYIYTMFEVVIYSLSLEIEIKIIKTNIINQSTERKYSKQTLINVMVKKWIFESELYLFKPLEIMIIK